MAETFGIFWGFTMSTKSLQTFPRSNRTGAMIDVSGQRDTPKRLSDRIITISGQAVGVLCPLWKQVVLKIAWRWFLWRICEDLLLCCFDVFVVLLFWPLKTKKKEPQKQKDNSGAWLWRGTLHLTGWTEGGRLPWNCKSLIRENWLTFRRKIWVSYFCLIHSTDSTVI